MKDKKDSVNINAGHRKRLRERFLRGGIKAFAPHEIIELILTFAIPQKDVKPLAKMLIDRFGSVSGILNAPPKLLMEQPGIKENSVTLLTLFTALNESLQEDEMLSGDLIANPLAAVRFLQSKIGRENREVLAMIFLDGSNHVLGCELHTGKLRKVSFYPQNIARGVLRNNATGVIVAHNHPSGVCQPSEADLAATGNLKAFLERLDLRLVDHLLITKLSHLSLLNRMGCFFKNYTTPPLEIVLPAPDLSEIDAMKPLYLDDDEVAF